MPGEEGKTEEPKKKKICCACPDTRKVRDAWYVYSSTTVIVCFVIILDFEICFRNTSERIVFLNEVPPFF